MVREILQRTGDIQIRQIGEGQEISGYAAVFYREGDPGTEYGLWGKVKERVRRSAFDDALATGADVMALFNHDSNLVLGRTGANTLRLSVDNVGLRYSIDIPDTVTGRDLAASIGRGDIAGSSFSFRVDREEWSKTDGGEFRDLLSVTVYDVGPVTFPAYKATTAAIRSAVMDSYNAWLGEQRRRDLDRASATLRMIDIDAQLAGR